MRTLVDSFMTMFAHDRALSWAIYVLVVLLGPLPSKAENTCGSLITYRQYSTLLSESAPTCLISGCTSTSKELSMSDTCPESEPCSKLWGQIESQYQQNWCSECPGDVACRIPGWPVLNSTAFCDVLPNSWLFGSDGSCCSSGNESFELAAWVGSMCNASQWRKPFEHYDRMAQLDWQEWILPWNWTVRAENTSSITVPPPKCSDISSSLWAFAGENILFLVLAIAISLSKVVYIHGLEEDWKGFRKFNKFCSVLTLWKCWTWRRKYRNMRRRRDGLEEVVPPPDSEDKTIALSVGWSAFMTALQVGFNFISAFLIKRTPGYQYVPIVKLAVLFCCRPRLTWITCFLEYIDEDQLKKYFGFREQRYIYKAKLALVTIGTGSAISEITLQGFSLYYMGLTANVGRMRGFYLLHRLRPYWKGHDAQHMYLGALFWLIGCVFIFIIWSLSFWLRIVAWKLAIGTYQRIRTAIRRRRDPAHRGPLARIFNLGVNQPQHEVGNSQEKIIGDNDQEIVREPADPGNHGAAGELLGQLNPEGGVEIIRGPPPTHGNDNERLPLRGAPPNHGNGNERLPLPVPPGRNENMNERIAPVVPHARANEEGIPRELQRDDVPHRREQENLLAQDHHAVQQDHIAEDEEPPVEASPDERSAKEMKDLFVGLGIFIGLLCWAVQWAFWAGFVYTAGPRFCPPSLVRNAGLWLAASVGGFGIPFWFQ